MYKSKYVLVATTKVNVYTIVPHLHQICKQTHLHLLWSFLRSHQPLQALPYLHSSYHQDLPGKIYRQDLLSISTGKIYDVTTQFHTFVFKFTK